MKISIPQSTSKNLFIIIMVLLLFLYFKFSPQFVILNYGNDMIDLVEQQ